MSATRDHDSGHGENQSKFDSVYEVLNRARFFASFYNSVTRKSVQDRYRKLVSSFKMNYRESAVKSGSDNEHVT